MISFPFTPFFKKHNLKYHKKPFHGKVYRFDEIKDLILKYGNPNDEGNNELPMLGFIEVQIWDEIPKQLMTVVLK